MDQAGANAASVVVTLLFVAGAVWLLLRISVFLRALFTPALRPIRRIVRPLEEQLYELVAKSADKADAHGAADLVRQAPHLDQRIRSGVNAALDKIEQKTAARREPSWVEPDR